MMKLLFSSSAPSSSPADISFRKDLNLPDSGQHLTKQASLEY